MNQEKVEQLVRELLVEIGENPEREGLLKTPERVAKALEFLTRGYRQDPEEKQNSIMTTSSVLGTFDDAPSTRAEFLGLIGRPRGWFV